MAEDDARRKGVAALVAYYALAAVGGITHFAQQIGRFFLR